MGVSFLYTFVTTYNSGVNWPTTKAQHHISAFLVQKYTYQTKNLANFKNLTLFNLPFNNRESIPQHN